MTDTTQIRVGEVRPGDRVVLTIPDDPQYSGPGAVIVVDRKSDALEDVRVVVALDSGPMVRTPLSHLTPETKAGEAIDGSDFPSREQQAVMNVAALKFGSVAIERVAGTDDMRMSTPEGDVIVDADGCRFPSQGGLDYSAILRVRKALTAEAERYYYRSAGKADGIAYEALYAAEVALFRALNVLANHCDDAEAAAALHA